MNSSPPAACQIFRKRRLVSLAFLFLPYLLHAQLTFGDLAVSPSSRLLFSAQFDIQGSTPEKAWFLSNLKTGDLETLTFPVDRASWFSATGEVQITNRFGTFRLSKDGSSIKVVSPEAFETKSALAVGEILPTAYSPDGAWALLQIRSSDVSADLGLWNVATGQLDLVTRDLVLSFESVPARWSPDGRFFIYEKEGALYYYSLQQRDENGVPDESLRRLGPGLLNDVEWGPNGELYYVREDLIYRVLPQEFFTLSLYGSRFQTWGVVARLPFPFHPAQDRFWVGRNSLVLLSLGGRTLFLYPSDYRDKPSSGSLRYIPFFDGMRVKRVLWDEDRATILVSTLQKGKEVSRVFRLTGAKADEFDVGNEVLDLGFSPKRDRILVTTGTGLSVRDAQTFVQTAWFPEPSTRAGFWVDPSTLDLCSAQGVERIDLSTGQRTPLVLGEGGGRIVFDSGVPTVQRSSERFAYVKKGVWKPIEPSKTDLPSVSTFNSVFRVFTESLSDGPYTNQILVRLLTASATVPLLPRNPAAWQPLSGKEDVVSQDGVFAHGSRIHAREIGLTISCRDSDDGLFDVLRTLKKWNVTATFFLNGEFLRRNPQAAREIAWSGQEVGNQFYIPFDFEDPRFTVDEAFVKKGLARQEDDWFRVTGKELSPFWQPSEGLPSLLAIRSAAAAGYLTVGTDLPFALPPDRCVDANQLILSLLQRKKPGSIIPLTLGMKDSRTGESFFTRLDLLLEALTESGYKIVPVSTLQEHVGK